MNFSLQKPYKGFVYMPDPHGQRSGDSAKYDHIAVKADDDRVRHFLDGPSYSELTPEAFQNEVDKL